MSYRCDPCGAVVGTGQNRLVHRLVRQTKKLGKVVEETEGEVPVCLKCSLELTRMRSEGVPSHDAIDILRRKHNGPKVLAAFPKT